MPPRCGLQPAARQSRRRCGRGSWSAVAADPDDGVVYEEALHRRTRTSLVDRKTWVHSAEVLAVFKMLFLRPKDLIDVERMRARARAVERAFVRDALVDVLGEDPRIERWDSICARVPA